MIEYRLTTKAAWGSLCWQLMSNLRQLAPLLVSQFWSVLEDALRRPQQQQAVDVEDGQKQSALGKKSKVCRVTALSQ
jgi:hypothetical protein